MPSELNEQLLLLYRRAKTMHHDAFALLDHVKSECRTNASAGQTMDATLLLKKTDKYVEETHKEIKRALEFVQRLGCVFAMQSGDNSIKGEVGRGYASTSQQASLPDRDKDPAAYAELLDAIGVQDSPLIRPSFTGVEALVTKLNEEGRQLPAGLAHCRMIDKFTVSAFVKSGVDLDELADRVALSHAGDSHEVIEDNPF